MSGTRERPETGFGLVEQALAAVDRPALVCDADGSVRGYNDALSEWTGIGADDAGTTFASVVDCDGDPLARALESGGETTGPGTIRTGEGFYPCLVTCRPLETDGGIAGCVVTIEAGEDRDAAWSLLASSVAGDGDYAFAVDDSYRLGPVAGDFERETGLQSGTVAGERLRVLADSGAFEAGTVGRLRDRIETLLCTDRTGITFTARVGRDDERVLEHRLRAVTHRGETVGAVAVVRDVTERAETTAALRESHRRLSAIVDHLPVVVAVVDGNERIEHFQDVEVSDFEYDREQLLGTDLSSLEEEYPAVVECCRDALEGDQQERTFDIGGCTFKCVFEPLQRADRERGALVTAVDVTERVENERRLAATNRRLNLALRNTDAGVFEWEIDDDVVYWHDSRSELYGLETDTNYRPKSAFRELLHPDDREKHRRACREAIAEDGSFDVECRIDHPEEGHRWLRVEGEVEYEDGDPARIVGIDRDVTERRRQQERLETLARIQQLVHESVGALAAATTETEIRTAVCERLAESPFYEFAWAGVRDPSGREVRPVCWAGIAGDSLDEVTVTVAPGETDRGPVGRAYRSGDVTVVCDVGDDPDVAPWREAALAGGFRSVAAVPFTHGSTTHGVLTVYADRPAAFGERELAAFETLGETVGFALSAAQNRRLLESETVLRLEFLATPREPALRTATVERDCRFVFDGVTGSGDGKTLCYLTVEGVPPDAVASILADAERVERVTRLDGGDGPQFELAVADSTFQLLADAGARGTRIVVEDGHSRIVAEAPVDADVRRVRDAIEANHREIRIVTRREVEPADTNWLPTAGGVDARLTDRQRSVLRAAYYSGYYDWPRETDAETLADSLGVATSTTLQHLRRGHRRVMASLFDG